MLLICCQKKPNMWSRVNALTLNIKLVVTDVNSYRVTLLLPMVLRSFVKESPPMPDARAPRKLISEAKILFSRYQHRATGEISSLRFFFFYWNGNLFTGVFLQNIDLITAYYLVTVCVFVPLRFTFMGTYEQLQVVFAQYLIGNIGTEVAASSAKCIRCATRNGFRITPQYV